MFRSQTESIELTEITPVTAKDFSKQPLSIKELNKIFATLNQSNQVYMLNFSQCELTEEGARLILQEIQRNPCIHVVDVSANKFSFEFEWDIQQAANRNKKYSAVNVYLKQDDNTFFNSSAYKKTTQANQTNQMEEIVAGKHWCKRSRGG